MVTLILRDGQKVTPWMNYQISRLDHDFHDAFGLHVRIRSGIRTYEDQKRIFLERYVTAGNVRGRRVYDTRWWSGVLWYRVSAAGTVAQPGTSNHEIQGSKAAVDLYDTGSDAGITTAGTRRANWLRANCGRYGLVASGYGFREPWHYDVLNIHNTPPAAPAGGAPTAPEPPKEGDTMQSIIVNGNQYGIDVEFLTHYGNVPQADITRKVASVTDELHNLGSGPGAVKNLANLMDGYGIPRTVLDNAGRVLNPQSGQFEWNGTWSRRREILAGQERIERKLDALAKSSEPDKK